MRILCVSNDIPLPANSGGRVDVWRRICALRAAGHTVALLCWMDQGRAERPTAEVMKRLEAVCESVRIVPITRSAKELAGRLLHLWYWPSHVASRWVTSRGIGIERWCSDFVPNVVFLDGLYGGAVAFDLSRRAGVPVWYRSHNIEHRYMAAQRERETRFVRRMGLLANCIGLERFERSVMQRARRVLDISCDDAAFWRASGVANVELLPTIVDADFVARLEAAGAAPPDVDILYFGNLNTPNNVEAVAWFVREVLPNVPAPDLRIVVAGSNPSDEMRVVLGLDARIELIENPVDMAAVVARARLLVNPMRAGSGVNLKSVEMLFSDAALVSTSVGVGGLPQQVKACFAVEDDARKFATAIENGLAEKRVVEAEGSREIARMGFLPETVANMVAGRLDAGGVSC
ncbi:MAG: glycosyltransferase [Proteobacteria bacterium]|nr:MAG: glycosyltransferase [Pseudomonadota bacterium]